MSGRSQEPPGQPVALSSPPAGYAEWLVELKARIHTAQQRAALTVNREMIHLYWQIGRDILERQARQGWGAKVIERLSHDLRVAFPEIKGFSRANLLYMRAFAGAWPDEQIVQQLVGRLPWGHNLVLLTRLKDQAARRQYAERAFKPDYTGQLGFYLSAVDAQIKSEHDGPTIGLLLCKTQNRLVAEYALRDINKPIGIAEYQLDDALPENLQTSLPSIEQIERELSEGENNE